MHRKVNTKSGTKLFNPGLALKLALIGLSGREKPWGRGWPKPSLPLEEGRLCLGTRHNSSPDLNRVGSHFGFLVARVVL